MIFKKPGSKEKLETILNQMDEFDLGISSSDILSLDEMQKALTVVGHLDIGTGEQILKGAPRRDFPEKIKNFKDKTQRAMDIIDEWTTMQGSDAGISLDRFMKGEINLRQAAWNAKPKDSPKWKRFASTHSGVRWRHVRNKINKFKAKFRKSKLSLDEFIEKNRAEYNNISRQLKYGKYLGKSHK
jgi:hypothetical protein